MPQITVEIVPEIKKNINLLNKLENEELNDKIIAISNRILERNREAYLILAK